MKKIIYPKTQKHSNIDILHGKSVEDNYRWLENDNDKEVISWQKEQNALADSILLSWPDRKKLRYEIYRGMLVEQDMENGNDRAIDSWKRINHSLEFDDLLPVFSSDYIFHVGKLQDKQQAVLFMTYKATSEKKILVDPNLINKDSGLDWFYPSPDGRYVAYGISSGGDEQSVLHIIETRSKKILPEEINFTSFARISWLSDSSGFYYSGG